MSRNKDYQRLLNDKRWQEVKAFVWRRAGGMCEQCREEGYLTPGVDCHHLIPVERCSLAEMERLCYDPNNIRLLCIPCHIRAHQQMHSHGKENIRANRLRNFERWKAKLEHLTKNKKP